MKKYQAPQLTKIQIQSGISFAAYSCKPDITDVVNAQGECENGVIDMGGMVHYCYVWDQAPIN